MRSLWSWGSWIYNYLCVSSNPVQVFQWLATGRWFSPNTLVSSTNFSYIMAISFIGVGTRMPGENHRPFASHWQTLTHNVVSSTPSHAQGFELTTLVVRGTDCTVSYQSSYHMIVTTTAPLHGLCTEIVGIMTRFANPNYICIFSLQY